jgi:signal transduction histidine kinase/DNA-binding NarL/FixJ family response regulator
MSVTKPLRSAGRTLVNFSLGAPAQMGRRPLAVAPGRETLGSAVTAALEILVVQSDAATARRLEEHLRAAGPVSVRAASSLAGGLEQLAGHRVDAVVIDLREAGPGAVSGLRSAAPETAVIALVPDPEAGRSALQEGALEWLPCAGLDAQMLGRAVRYATERKRAEAAERRARFLLEAGRLLASSLEREKVLEAIATLAVPALADCCTIVVEDQGELRCELWRHRDEEKQPLLDALVALGLPSDPGHPTARALRLGFPVLMPDLSVEPLVGHPEELRVLQRLAPTSWLTVPFPGRNRTLGALNLAITDGPRRFGAEELALASELASRASLALENAQLYRQAQQAVRARDEMLAIVSHDLRNPLNVVSVTAALMQRQAGDDERQRRQLGKIRLATQRMTTLIRDLLDVAQLEAGRFRVEPGPYPAAQVIEEALELVRPLAVEKGLRLEVEIAGELPEIQVEHTRALQVFSNLLGNGIKFTPAGGRVTVEATELDGFVRFVVSDTGPGIAADDLPRIFDRFWRARESSQDGTGLGLSIARGIVEAHGGRLWAESTVGQGSRFFFTFPIARLERAHGGG